MDTMFLKPIWLYLPDGSSERIIAQTGDDKGIGFDSIQAGVERRHYFRYKDHSITQTERGDYVVSPVDDGCEKIYYPNGVYEYVSKVVQHNGFWEAHVRRNSFSKWRVDCWSRRYVSLERKYGDWYWRRIGRYKTDPDCDVKFTDGPICLRVSDSYYAHVKRVCRYFTGEWCIWYEDENGEGALLSFDEQLYKLTLNDNVLHITMRDDEYVEDDVHENVVSHPSHYAALDPEPITFIRDKDYLTGSALKHIFRAGHKNGADENIDTEKAAWYLRELVAERGSQTAIAILQNVYWDTIGRQLAPEDRAKEIRDRLVEFTSAISHDRLNNYIPEA